jgi:hypothetical protein
MIHFDDNNTRRYPRTLWEAFPDERAKSIEHYSEYSLADLIIAAIGIGFLAGLVIGAFG